MRDYLQMLIFVTIGISLLWFGYSLIMGQWSGIRRNMKYRFRRKVKGTSTPGDPQVCPICSSKLNKNDLVKTLAFPSVSGGRDRLMYIRGCVYCLSGHLERNCPVCGASLGENEILVARMFERTNRRSHVHVQGCTRCKRMGTR